MFLHSANSFTLRGLPGWYVRQLGNSQFRASSQTTKSVFPGSNLSAVKFSLVSSTANARSVKAQRLLIGHISARLGSPPYLRPSPSSLLSNRYRVSGISSVWLAMFGKWQKKKLSVGEVAPKKTCNSHKTELQSWRDDYIIYRFGYDFIIFHIFTITHCKYCLDLVIKNYAYFSRICLK